VVRMYVCRPLFGSCVLSRAVAGMRVYSPLFGSCVLCIYINTSTSEVLIAGPPVFQWVCLGKWLDFVCAALCVWGRGGGGEDVCVCMCVCVCVRARV